MVKPTPGKSMFNFGSFVDSSKSPTISPDKNFGGQPMSPDSEAKPLPGGRRQPPPMGLQLDSRESDSETRDIVVEEKKNKRPPMGLMIEDSQDEDELDLDG